MKHTYLLHCWLPVSLLLAAAVAIAAPPTTMTLPINTTQAATINLRVTVPDHFKALTNPQKIPQFSMMEYVPDNETGDQWTKILTTNSFIGKKLKASDFIGYMQQRFKQIATQVNVVNTTLVNYPNYQKACTTMDYHVNQRHEMVYMCYYSGAMDMAGVQYAVLYPTDKSAVSDVATQLENVVNTQVQVQNPETPLTS